MVPEGLGGHALIRHGRARRRLGAHHALPGGRRRVESRVLPERRLELTVPQRRVPGGTCAHARAQTDDHDSEADAATDHCGYDPGMPHVPSVRRRRRRVPSIYLVPRQRRLPGLSGLHVFRPGRRVLRHDRHTPAHLSPRHDAAAHGRHRRRVPRVSRLRRQRRLPRDYLLQRQ
jgi:hypothetical protein